MTGILDSIEMPKLAENQKSFAGIPEAIFLVSCINQCLIGRLCYHNLIA